MRTLFRLARTLLTAAQQRRWLALAPLLVLTGSVEAVATGLVYVLIKIAGDPAYALSLRPLAAAFAALDLREPRAIVLAYGAFLGGFFVVRSVLLAVVARAETGAVAFTAAELSTRLLHAYLGAPFALHLRHSSTELAHDATGTVERTATGLGSIVQVVAEGLVSAGLAAFLLVAAPVVTLVTTATLGLLVWAALRLTKRSSRRWGRAREEQSRRAYKDLQQILGGVREIMVLGRERPFQEAYAAEEEALARTRRTHNTLIALPRIAIETIFVACVVLVVALLTLGGSNGADLMPLLGVYAYAGFRFIPSANRLLLHVDSLRTIGPAVERLVAHLALFEGARRQLGEDEGPPLAFERDVVLDRVGFTYETGPAPVFADVSLRVARGQSIGIVGPTGSGKSTLVDLVLGLLDPTSGELRIDGAPLPTVRRAWQRAIGYVPQAAFLFDDTIARNVALGVPPERIDRRRLEEALRMAQLADFVATLPQGADTRIGERGVRLSGGQRQRVAIARALYHQPAVLVFDEATAALDNATEREVTRAIEALHGEKTLIVIAHRLSTVQSCDALVFLAGGRVRGVGTFAALLEDCPEFREMAAGPVAAAAGDGR
jgi:ATP-binding cassette subfamily C protein